MLVIKNWQYYLILSNNSNYSICLIFLVKSLKTCIGDYKRVAYYDQISFNSSIFYLKQVFLFCQMIIIRLLFCVPTIKNQALQM